MGPVRSSHAGFIVRDEAGLEAEFVHVTLAGLFPGSLWCCYYDRAAARTKERALIDGFEQVRTCTRGELRCRTKA